MNTPNPAQTFLIEAADLLDQVEEIVLEVEKAPRDRETVNRLFRAFHTIKGSGAMFGFEAIAAFTHHVETALDHLRKGEITVTPNLIALILNARDHLQKLLSSDGGTTAGLEQESGRLAREFSQLVAKFEGPRLAVPRVVVAPEPAKERIATYRIRFRPNPGIATGGLDPAALLQELRGLGKCAVLVDVGGVPALEHLAPTQCWLAWEVILTTDRGLNAIKDVFIFVEDGSELRIEEMPATAAPATMPAAPAPASKAQAKAPEPVTEAASLRAIREGVVRVPSAKLDHIVSLVGELVISESRLAQVSSRLNVSELSAPVEAIERLIAEMRDAVLGIRMMPIGSTFSRFKRLVHDLSRDLAKDVQLVTEGAETELDKTVLDQLADPLVHLIRNSIDHGIGTPAERVATGKPALGTVRLTATHAGSHVVVTVSDDGRGLDPDRIRAKAIERQLIAADANLSEAEIFDLIFLPGFSTATTVTEVSGRGVGMDVVRKQIDALRGSIQLTSTRGVGTTVALSLPLTLAIIEGLLVSIGSDPFIIPMSAVTETVELRREERGRNNGRNLISVRGELVSYLHLRELFEVEGEEPAVEKIVIARFGRDRVGLVVDRVLGSHQTVIQSLGRMFRQIGVVSGGTILGDGRVALILDLSGVVAFADRRANAQTARTAFTTTAA